MFKNLDRKQRLELAITGIGILFLIFLIPANTKKIQSKKAAQVRTYTEAMSVSLESPVPGIKRHNLESGWGRDPFYPEMPFAGASSGIAGFVLNGIVWDNNAPYAIINSEVVKTGDKLDTETTVVEITEKSVTLEQNSERHVLQLSTF